MFEQISISYTHWGAYTELHFRKIGKIWYDVQEITPLTQRSMQTIAPIANNKENGEEDNRKYDFNGPYKRRHLSTIRSQGAFG